MSTRTPVVAFCFIASLLLISSLQSLAGSKPGAAKNPYIEYLRIPGWPEPPRVADFSTKEGHKLYSVDLHTDSATFVQISAPFEGFVGGEAVWADYDEDGLLDVLVAGFNDTIFTTRIYHNDGNGQFTDIHAPIAGLGTFRGVAWGDYDNDGDLDLAISGATNWEGDSASTRIFRNDNGVFTDINAGLFPLNFGSMNWVDYDNDGDLDLFCTGSPDKSIFHSILYRNDDSVFTEVQNTGIVGVWGSCSAWADYDGDGYSDLALMGWGGYNVTAIYHNNAGDGTFTDIHAPLTAIVHGSIAWIDYDNDGRLDLSIEGTTWGYVPITEIYHNVLDTATGLPTFVNINANIMAMGVGAMTWGDYDNDGYMDFAISGARDWWGDSAMTKIYRNVNGTGEFRELALPIPGNYSGSLAWGDYDNDGRLDLLLEGATNPSHDMPPTVPFYPIAVIMKNVESSTNAIPTAPEALTVQGAGNTNVRLRWDAGTDGETPSPGLSYNLRIGTTPGGIEVVSPNSIVATGYRRMPKTGNVGSNRSMTVKNLPAGKYYWSVQSVDNELAGSSFTNEESFVITPAGTVLGANSRWYMVSDPYGHADMHVSALYPSARSQAYSYTSGGAYAAQAIMENGTGYWLKYSVDTLPHTVDGGVISSLTIAVHEGWNLIGAISSAQLASTIGSSVPDMVTSQFFGYTGLKYAVSDVLEPGKGYWVKVSTAGSIMLGTAAATAHPIRIVISNELPPSPPSGEEIASVPAEKPKAMALEQNYPNPFNPSTSIRYALTVASQVRLVVYNVLGQEVATLADGLQEAGYKGAEWDATAMPSGLYFYRLDAVSAANPTERFQQVRKMMLVK